AEPAASSAPPWRPSAGRPPGAPASSWSGRRSDRGIPSASRGRRRSSPWRTRWRRTGSRPASSGRTGACGTGRTPGGRPGMRPPLLRLLQAVGVVAGYVAELGRPQRRMHRVLEQLVDLLLALVLRRVFEELAHLFGRRQGADGVDGDAAEELGVA